MTPRPAASNATLAGRTQVFCQDSNLYSVNGAQTVISMIKSRHVVHKLLLSHNELGDEGCIALFEFLSSVQGRRHPISEIHIGSNKITNAGWLAIIEYLKDNHDLQRLFLPNNKITGDAPTTLAFAHAVNKSRLEILNLSSNNLGDSFAELFLPPLNCPTLQHLSLTATHLTAASVPFITKHLSSTLCRFNSFSCSVNQLGTCGVRTIADAIKRHNYRLTEASFYANNTDLLDESLLVTREIIKRLTITLTRNSHFKGETERDALRLLRYARPLLMNASPSSDWKSLGQSSEARSCFPSAGAPPPPSSTPVPSDALALEIPPELKHHILSFLAPSLSNAQLLQIYHYASSAATLPRLLPSLRGVGARVASSAVCVPDPASLGIGGSGAVWNINGGAGNGGACAGGKCMGAEHSVVCQREQERTAWLAVVGCDAYDP